LFRRHNAVIEMSFDPATPCNSFATVASLSWAASWKATSEGLQLEGFDGNRRLIICESGEHYEVNDPDYPSDKEYPYDNLNGVQLWKVQIGTPRRRTVWRCRYPE